MANYQMLKTLIDERGMKRTFIASKMGVTDKRLHELLNGIGPGWKLREVVAISKVLGLTKKQREDIFFTTV